MLVQTIIDQVRTLLVDASAGLYSNKDIGQAINEGEQAVGYLRPDELSYETDLTLAIGSRQTLPADAIRLRDVLYNRGKAGALLTGSVINLVERGVLDRLGDWRTSPPAEVVEEFMYDERHPRGFDVYPPMVDAATVVRVDYEREPPTYLYSGSNLATPSSTVTFVSDKYVPALIEWAQFRMLSRQDDITPSTIDGSTNFQRFMDLLGVSATGDATQSLKQRMQLK